MGRAKRDKCDCKNRQAEGSPLRRAGSKSTAREHEALGCLDPKHRRVGAEGNLVSSPCSNRWHTAAIKIEFDQSGASAVADASGIEAHLIVARRHSYADERQGRTPSERLSIEGFAGMKPGKTSRRPKTRSIVERSRRHASTLLRGRRPSLQ